MRCITGAAIGEYAYCKIKRENGKLFNIEHMFLLEELLFSHKGMLRILFKRRGILKVKYQYIKTNVLAKN